MVKKNAATVRTALFLGACFLTTAVHADVAIKPAFVEVNLDEGRPSGTFLISNLGNREERFRVNALHFNYTEEGGLKKTPTGNYSLAPLIRFNPRELTLAPGTQRAVRFAIILRGRLPEGEHWAAMELENLAVNDTSSKDEKTGRSVKLKLITTIIAPIFGTVGKTTYDGQIKEIQVQAEKDAVVLKTLVAATGTGRLGLSESYELTDSSGKVVESGPFATGYVFRGSQRWFSKRFAPPGLPQGEYTVKVTGDAPHLGQPLVKETRVAWPELPPVDPTQAAAGPNPASPEKAPNTSVPTKQPDQLQGPTDGSKPQTEMQGSVRPE